MEQIRFQYSAKNIPTASRSYYIKQLIEKAEQLLKNMRWRAIHYLKPKKDKVEKENYGFKTSMSPPQIDEMIVFENKMAALIKSIEFTEKTNTFQRRLKNDIKRITQDNKLIIGADKTANYYKMDKDKYRELLKVNIEKTYKIAPSNQVSDINKESKRLAEKLDLDDRIETLAEREAFISLKDHKNNFWNQTKCRTINPAKNDLGRVSKKETGGNS